jgi:hypothetical protein
VRVLLAAHPSEAITAYATLQPEAKLALLVALVDAATDTKSANTAAEAKHNERVKLEGAWEAQVTPTLTLTLTLTPALPPTPPPTPTPTRPQP